jgi:hypothetical protein
MVGNGVAASLEAFPLDGEKGRPGDPHGALSRRSPDVDFVNELLEDLNSLLSIAAGELYCDLHSVNVAANCASGHGLPKAQEFVNVQRLAKAFHRQGWLLLS